jgi:hypothetical protein
VQQRGRPDHFKSTFAFSAPTLPVNGQTVVMGRLVLRDRDGLRLTTGGANVRVTLDPTNSTNATVGAVRDNGDGTYDVPITAGTTTGRLVLRVTVDDGTGARLIGPNPSLLTASNLLWANPGTMSVATGGTVDFALHAGATRANKTWLLLGSASGTRPGIMLPPFWNLPLNPDAVFHAMLYGAVSGLMPELTGITRAGGVAGTALTFPPGMYLLPVGIDLAFAYAVVNPIQLTSNAVLVRLTQ